jgi:hypothetical protein
MVRYAAGLLVMSLIACTASQAFGLDADDSKEELRLQAGSVGSQALTWIAWRDVEVPMREAEETHAPVVTKDVRESDDAEEGREAIPSDHAVSDKIVWGRAARPVQLGWRIVPKEKNYASGAVFTVALFLRNAGREAIHVASPNTEILEKLGLNLSLRDADGEELPWKWGPAHADNAKLTVSGAVAATLAPGATFKLPSLEIAIGKSDAPKTIMAYLELQPGQTARLTFKLSSLGIARGDEERLESHPFEFRVAYGTISISTSFETSPGPSHP